MCLSERTFNGIWRSKIFFVQRTGSLHSGMTVGADVPKNFVQFTVKKLCSSSSVAEARDRALSFF